MKIEFPRQIFEKCSNIKFHDNLSGGSHVLWGRKGMTKLVLAFRNFPNAPKKNAPCWKLRSLNKCTFTLSLIVCHFSLSVLFPCIRFITWFTSTCHCIAMYEQFQFSFQHILLTSRCTSNSILKAAEGDRQVSPSWPMARLSVCPEERPRIASLIAERYIGRFAPQ